MRHAPLDAEACSARHQIGPIHQFWIWRGTRRQCATLLRPTSGQPIPATCRGSHAEQISPASCQGFPGEAMGDTAGVPSGQVTGQVTSSLTQAMAAAYWVTPGRAGPDQGIAGRILASRPPPNVKEGPVSTDWHGHVASAGRSAGPATSSPGQTAPQAGHARSHRRLVTMSHSTCRVSNASRTASSVTGIPTLM